MMDEIKPGDVFDVRLEAVEVRANDRVLVTTPTTGHTEIAGYLLRTGRRVARPLAIGDRVRSRQWVALKPAGVIAAIHGDWAWVSFKPDCSPQNELLSDLERAPAPDTKGHQAGCACECCGGGRDQP